MNERKKSEIEVFKKTMLAIKPVCELCGQRTSEELHHLLPQSELNKKLYPEYIHDMLNLVCVCRQCHKDKARHIDEIQFCLLMGIEPRSKSGRQLWKRRISA